MKNNILLHEVLDGLTQLSQRNEQIRLWLSDGTSGEVSSFTEAICGIYDDGGVSRALESEALIGALADSFTELRKLIAEIPENAPPLEIMNHPAMKRIGKLASELRSSLQEGG